MPDLASTHRGLPLRNPLVASASPLSESVERARRLHERAAIVPVAAMTATAAGRGRDRERSVCHV